MTANSPRDFSARPLAQEIPLAYRAVRGGALGGGEGFLNAEQPSKSELVSLASQTIWGSFYTMVASLVTLTLGLLRSVLLARLLLPEHFGVMTLAMFYIALTAQLRALGLDQALIHQQDVDETT
ncbi:MAG: oligosaccharide flippase family protein, partial [Anaerolineae bacterium]